MRHSSSVGALPPEVGLTLSPFRSLVPQTGAEPGRRSRSFGNLLSLADLTTMPDHFALGGAGAGEWDRPPSGDASVLRDGAGVGLPTDGDEGHPSFSPSVASRGSDRSLLVQFQWRLAVEVMDVLVQAGRSVVPPLAPLSATTNYGDETYQAAAAAATSLLHDLGHNLSTPVEEDVLNRLRHGGRGRSCPSTPSGTPLSLARAAAAPTAPLSSPGPAVYYYQLLADHFRECSDAAMAQWFPVWTTLWGHEAFAPVFALLYHKWLLRHPVVWSDVLADRLSLLHSGALRLFWSDVQLHLQTYAPLYQYLLTALRSLELWSALPVRVRLTYNGLLCQFFLQYCPGDALLDLLESLPPVAEGIADSPPVGDLISVNASLFVTEVVTHLRETKNPQSLLVFLVGLRGLARVPLNSVDPVVMNKLQSGLYALMNPGGPCFPSREVRHAARQTVDVLFPSGRQLRALVHVCFRLLHPYYWPSSLLHWAQSRCSGRWWCSSAFDFVFSTTLKLVPKPLHGVVRRCCCRRAALAKSE